MVSCDLIFSVISESLAILSTRFFLCFFDELHQLKQYSAFIIPIRNLNEAALSRSVQERFARAVLHENDHWKWNSSAQFAGGAIYDTSMLGISQVLSKGLWSLIEALARAGIQPIIISFPRFAEDFCYLWDQIGDIVSGSSRDLL